MVSGGGNIFEGVTTSAMIYRTLEMCAITAEMHDTHFGRAVAAFLQDGYTLDLAVVQAHHTYFCASEIPKNRPSLPHSVTLTWYNHETKHMYTVPNSEMGS